MVKQKNTTNSAYPNAWERFERAVDVAPKTPPMHKEPSKKKPTKKATKANKS